MLFSQNINISVTGNWTRTIAASDISEAGNDYPAAYVSNLNQTLMTISPNNNNKLINVLVSRDNIAWHNNLNLKVKRTANGTNGNTNISGGLIFQTITSVDANFFTCTGTHNFVPLQYEISGISVVLPVQNYSTTITYTVIHP